MCTGGVHTALVGADRLVAGLEIGLVTACNLPVFLLLSLLITANLRAEKRRADKPSIDSAIP